MNDKSFGNLSSSMYLFIGVKVVLMRNYLNIGLSNGSIGITKEIIHNPIKSTPSLS